MTLNLLLGRRPPEGKAVILADPAGGSIEPALAGLISQLGEVQLVVFPLPDDTTRRHLAPPPLMRSRHADLWHVLSEDERARALLVAGPTAAYLAPIVEGGTTTVVAVPDPRQAIAPGVNAWRSVLGPFPELDNVPETAGSEEERDRWLDRVRTATSELELVRATELREITRKVAAGIGFGPKQTERAATVALSAGGNAEAPGRRKTTAHWLDDVVFSLSPAPQEQRAGRRRPRSAPASRPVRNPPPRQGRRRKRRRR